MRSWFYDTWGFVALANGRDAAHGCAAEADRWREAHHVAIVTSDCVMDETLTMLQSAAGPRVALRFADLLEFKISARAVMLVDVTSERRGRALALFRGLAPDTPRISFTDCTSFAVMEDLDIEVAFTADRHFRRAGEGIRPLFDFEDGRATWSPPSYR